MTSTRSTAGSGAAIPRRRGGRAACAGFTLVEVMVALLIMAVMAALAWQGIDGIARARASNSARMEATMRLNTVLAQWATDLQKVYNSPAVQPLSFDGATVRIVRSTDSGVQVVAWALRGSTWTRWSGPVVTHQGELQDSWMRSQQLLGNEDNQLRALEGVSSIQVYFYRRNGWSNAQSSGDLAQDDEPPADEAPPTPQPAASAASGAASGPTAGGPPRPARRAMPQIELPTGVRLVLEFSPESGDTRLSGTLTRDVALAPQQP